MVTLGAVGRALTVLVGCLTFIVGLVHIAKTVELSDCEDSSTISCIGKSLRWNTRAASSPINDVNKEWRDVFTFSPDPFFEYWTPILLGVLTLMIHFGGEPGWFTLAIASTWVRLGFWLAFVALYGNFGYAGNFGIVVALITCMIAGLCLIIALISRGDQVAPDTRMSIDPSDRYVKFVPNVIGKVFAKIVIFSMFLLGLCTVALGIMVIIEELPDICASGSYSYDGDDMRCFGPGLIWIPRTSDVSPGYGINSLSGGDDWGSFFSLQPSVFFDLMTPLIFGIVAVLASISSDMFMGLTSSWSALFLFFLVQALFGQFGYAGNYGIVLGFISIALAILSLITTCTAEPPEERRIAWKSSAELHP